MNKGTVEGLSQASTPPTHEDEFLRSIRHSNEVFSAFKAQAWGRTMQERLLDGEGKLRSFAEWKKEVEPISRHHVGAWLRTEYDTAVIRAHQAAEWLEFERNKDILPNLQWMPTTSPSPEAGHRLFWEKPLILPVDDPFWSEHRPGDRWNCKCSLDATDDDPRPLDPSEQATAKRPEHSAQPGLDGNPAYKGLITDSHPYYPKSCAVCPHYKAVNLKAWLKRKVVGRVKECHSCPYMSEAIRHSKAEPPELDTYSEVKEYEGRIYVSPYHGKDEYNENVRIAKILTEALQEKVYLLPRLDPKNPEEIRLRKKLHPPGVFDGKNPDYLIGGKIYDAKVMQSPKEKLDYKGQKSRIENRIKSAKEQADNFIIEIPSEYNLESIKAIVENYLSRSKKDRDIIILYGGKVYRFSK